MTVAAWVYRAVAPLDVARRGVLRAAVPYPRLLLVLTRRDARLAVLMTGHALVAFLLAVFAPMLLLVLGPVLLGVVHVAADVRYLVLRRELPRHAKSALLVFSGLLLGLHALAGTRFGQAEWALVTLAVVLASLTGARSRGRGALGAAVAAALGGLAIADPERARLVFTQAHNVVALALWLLVFRRDRVTVAAPLAMVAGFALILGSGALWQVTLHHGQASAFGVHILAASDWFAPGLRADHAIGLTSAFAFLQSVHYAVWLLYVPQDDAKSEATPSFRASLRRLVDDFGARGLTLVASAAVAVALLACFHAVATRHQYLSLAFFHGTLELVLLAYFWARGGARSLVRTA